MLATLQVPRTRNVVPPCPLIQPVRIQLLFTTQNEQQTHCSLHRAVKTRLRFIHKFRLIRAQTAGSEERKHPTRTRRLDLSSSPIAVLLCLWWTEQTNSITKSHMENKQTTTRQDRTREEDRKSIPEQQAIQAESNHTKRRLRSKVKKK